MDEREPLLIGIIGKAHGLNGEICLNTYNQGSELIFEGATVLLKNAQGEFKAVSVLKSRMLNKNGRKVVRLENINSRLDAESVRGRKVFTSRDNLEELDDQTFYYTEIIGYTVYTEENVLLGVVDYAFEAATDILVVGHDDQEWMIPVATDVVLSINHKKRTFNVRLPEGLEPGKRGQESPK
jgi:16S rRNA processing protein RimM